MRVFGLIGNPLEHSFSKRYFEDKFIREGLNDCAFRNYPLADIGLFPDLLTSENQLRGLAVTIPFKQTAIPYLSELDPLAEIIGAVNCVCFKNGLAIGYNTDVIGFQKSLSPMLKPHHQRAILLGNGGAAAAARHVLNRMGIGILQVCRHPRTKDEITFESLTADSVAESLLVINATPVGMYPHVDECPSIPYEFISSEHLLFDMVYNPEPSLFLQKGMEMGAAVKSGREMLHIQAEENWRIWNQG